MKLCHGATLNGRLSLKNFCEHRNRIKEMAQACTAILRRNEEKLHHNSFDLIFMRDIIENNAVDKF